MKNESTRASQVKELKELKLLDEMIKDYSGNTLNSNPLGGDMDVLGTFSFLWNVLVDSFIHNATRIHHQKIQKLQ